MVLNLKHSDFLSTGVFGFLTGDNDGKGLSLFTLEHAYSLDVGIFAPKLPPGIYVCIRGSHQLSGMAQPFETFEIMNVPGHTGILFHCGNTENDSEGCVLLGLTRDGDNAVLHSRDAFREFMAYLDGQDSFQLNVE